MAMWIWGTDMIQLEVAIWLCHSLWTWWVLLGYIIKKFSAGRDRKRAGCCHTTELVMSTPVHRGGIGRRRPGPMSNVIRKSKRIYCVKRQPEWSKSLHSCGCYFNLCLNIVADHLYLLIIAGSLKQLQILYEGPWFKEAVCTQYLMLMLELIGVVNNLTVRTKLGF